jgi:hypothetical protein
VRLAAVSGEQPPDVGAAARSLLASDPELLHEVVLRVGRGHVDGQAKALHQALGIALVPRRRQHDRRPTAGRKLVDLARRRERVEEQQALAVVDRIGRDHLLPGLTCRPVRVRRLPVP